jgi:hypothetical protein
MEDEVHKSDHLTNPWNSLSTTSNLQSLEPLAAQVEHDHRCSIQTFASDQVPYVASLRNDTFGNRPPSVLEVYPGTSSPNYEFENTAREYYKQMLKCETENGDLGTGSQNKSTPTIVAPSRTTASIYRKLFYAFLARRILNHKPTIFNRRTRLKLCKSENEDAENEDGFWQSESGAEKAQRTLQLLGIEMAHTAISWNQRQFIETNLLGKYRCYRPSFLRWSWTMIEERETEAIPIGGA